MDVKHSGRHAAENVMPANDALSRNGRCRIESADGRFTFRPRLRVLADASTSSGSRFPDRNISGTELRLVRLGADGGIGDFAYRAEIDFAGDEVTIRDAWFGYEKNIGFGELRLLAGNKLNDRSLDGATSLTSIPFAERNTVANLIAPQGGSYGVGVFASLAGERGHLSVNVKGEGEGANDGTRNDSLVVIGRGHLVPLRGAASTPHAARMAGILEAAAVQSNLIAKMKGRPKFGGGGGA